MVIPVHPYILHIILILITAVTFLISLYAFNWCLLTVLSLRGRTKIPSAPVPAHWPLVSINIPLYNEPRVAGRLLEACISIDYPREKLEIIVVDDSTDRTTQIVREYEASWPGLVRVIHRSGRKGYKAGALQEALRLSKGEFVAIFDADYVPGPSFLRDMIPHFYSDSRLAFVQARCGYLNPNSSWVSKGVSLALDGYSIIDQRARFASNLIAHFSGTNGVFRKSAIQSVGGWSAETLAEDLDLSIRLQLNGWKYLYLPNIVCSGEVPPFLSVFLHQQFRWAKGFSECFRLYWRSILRHGGFSRFQKGEALFLLATYFLCPLSVLGFALTMLYYAAVTPAFILGEYWTTLYAPVLSGLSTVIYVAPLMVYGTAVRELHRGRKRLTRLLHLPCLLGLGFVAIFTNSLAVLEGLFGIRSPFERTPKYGLIEQ